jgi:hypothetical protein
VSYNDSIGTLFPEPMPPQLRQAPPATPWGINFGGGLNSTALIVEAHQRGLRPDWILFADTGSELPGTLDHVAAVDAWCRERDWTPVTTVRWERVRGDIKGFEPLHDHCLRTNHLPSKAYGLAGCTVKWKVQPMDKWRKANGYQRGAFAIGYDFGEERRVQSAMRRTESDEFMPWYPLVAWGIDRDRCSEICRDSGFVIGKSSCFMCPNMRKPEWRELRDSHPEYFKLAVEIEENAAKHGNFGRGGIGLCKGGLRNIDDNDENDTDDSGMCHLGGCFT